MDLPLIAVTGKNGQLGRELQTLAPAFTGYRFVFTGSDELDITDREMVDAFFKQHQPGFFINAAAYTAVDRAESDQETALRVNGHAPGYLAKKAGEYNCRFITVSTDYVFNGNGSKPYLPADATDPVNYYGYSKRVGEQLAMEHNSAAIIIRTSWVYSPFGSNFVKTMLRLMMERDQLSIVHDQTGSPTYAQDLAQAILAVIKKIDAGNIHAGIFHYCNEGVISWFEFAAEIKAIVGLSCELRPISSSAYPAPARRPDYSALDTSSFERDFGIQKKQWQNSLQTCLLERILPSQK